MQPRQRSKPQTFRGFACSTHHATPFPPPLRTLRDDVTRPMRMSQHRSTLMLSECSAPQPSPSQVHRPGSWGKHVTQIDYSPSNGVTQLTQRPYRLVGWRRTERRRADSAAHAIGLMARSPAAISKSAAWQPSAHGSLAIRSQKPSLRPKEPQRRRSVSAVIARRPSRWRDAALGTSIACAKTGNWLIPNGPQEPPASNLAG